MDKSFRWKLLLTVGLIALGAWVLYPTLQLYRLPAAERDASTPEMRKLRGKSLKLGLDLLGGMHLVLELDKEKLTPAEVPDALDRAMEILRNRIDQFGVAEPTIQKQGEDRILIQLPEVQDKQRAVDLIGQTALLEFKLVKSPAETRQVIDRLDRAIAAKSEGLSQAALADSALADSLLTERPLADLLVGYPEVNQYGGITVADSDVDAVEALLGTIDLDTALPPDVSIAFSQKSEAVGQGVVGRTLYVLNRKPSLTGAAIKNAIMKIGLDSRRPNSPGVSMTLNARGTNIFRKVTGANVHKQLAIVLDGKVASAPVIQDRIPTGRAQITGSFTDAEAKDLAIVLRAGALPAPLRVIEERTVGPSLGRDSIRTSLNAGLVGAIAVVLFMLVYYRLSGLVAVFALCLNIFFLMAGLAGLRGTLTLPGIAGIVLTVGMAVDANVLIFERIREEIKNGKRIRAAIDAGYDRAFRTILDANLTTLISAAVLFQFGTGPIKGFAITLAIGIIANLYTAVLVTRLVFDAVTSRRALKTLSI